MTAAATRRDTPAMLLPLLALALQAASPPAPANDDTIVVTATMAQLKAALDRCRQGGCTPRQDIVASIRYAEAVFRAGKYLDARRALQDAIARDKAAGPADPQALSALYEATVTVALHDGEQDVARRAGGARMKLLRDHFGAEDARLLQAELDQADTLLGTRQADEAIARYPIIARRAAVAGLPTLHAAAVMRQALVAHADRSERAANTLLAGLIDDETLSPAMRLAARALVARFAHERGNDAPAEALVVAFAQAPQYGPPVLVWQPPIREPDDPDQPNPFSVVSPKLYDNDFTRAPWADIGFLIKPDGTVEPPELLRGSPTQGWSYPILKAIARRHYVPTAGATPLYRIERWTLTGDYCVPSGSLIRQRACAPHFVQLDLTPAPPAATGPA